MAAVMTIDPDGGAKYDQSDRSPNLRKKATVWILWAICLLFLLHVWFYDFVSDDAFITLRYARNLAQGEGLVFNPGDRVEGITSMLWTLLLSVFGMLGIDMLVAARALGVVAGIATIVLTYRLYFTLPGAEELPGMSVFAPLILALNGSFACWASSGMETPLFVSLTVGSYLMVLKEKWNSATVVTSACILTRPEGLIVFFLLVVFQLLRTRRDGDRRWLRWLFGCGTAAFALFAFRLFYFGELLPNTYYVKTGGGWAQIGRGFRYLVEYAADYEGLLIMAIPVAFFLMAGDSRLRFLAASVVTLWGAAVWVGGDGLPMYRFALAPLPFLLLLQGVLIGRLYQLAIESNRFSTKTPMTLLVISILLLAVTHASRPIVGYHYSLYDYQKNVEIPRWTLVGKWLKNNAAREDSVATVPIGAVSYYSELRVYDMLGLTDRHIAHLEMQEMGKGWAGHEKHDGQHILRQRPTYLLLGNIDVTTRPRDPRNRPFIPYVDRLIWKREKDFYETDLLDRMYAPRSIEIAPDQYLNLYQLKKEYR